MAFFAVSWREPARIADLTRRVFGLIGVVGWASVFIVLCSLRAPTLSRRQIGAVRAAELLARACLRARTSFAHQAARALLYRSPDGKVQEFLLLRD